MDQDKVQKNFHYYLGQFEIWFATIAFTLMLIEVLANIVMRELKIPFPWGEEIARYLMIAGIMAGLGICARKNSHIAVDMLTNVLKGTPKKIVGGIADLLSLGCYILLFCYTIDFVIKNSKLDQVTASLHLPIYMVYLLLVLGFALSLIEYLYAMVHKYILRKPIKEAE
jgi:C4-dicarboxylate transporter DctQ subunit